MLMKNKVKTTASAVKGHEYVLAEANTQTVRHSVITTFQAALPSDPTDAQMLGIVEQSGVLDFWSADEEDVYTREDGEAI